MSDTECSFHISLLAETLQNCWMRNVAKLLDAQQEHSAMSNLLLLTPRPFHTISRHMHFVHNLRFASHCARRYVKQIVVCPIFVEQPLWYAYFLEDPQFCLCSVPRRPHTVGSSAQLNFETGWDRNSFKQLFKHKFPCTMLSTYVFGMSLQCILPFSGHTSFIQIIIPTPSYKSSNSWCILSFSGHTFFKQVIVASLDLPTYFLGTVASRTPPHKDYSNY